MVTCPACGHENPDSSRFCGQCGAALVPAVAPTREERKVVTILFTDLVGSTERAEGLDPEDVRATLSAYYAQLRAELERHGGTVEKFIGDAVMAVFGAPVSHEDDAERAVRAALAIRDSIGEELQIRTAVNTGEALVALGAKPGEGDAMVAGDVVNTAARLQSAAPVNGILVGEGTYRATRQAIEYRDAPPVEAKGKAEPVKVWEAVAARSRFGSDVEQKLRTPLVGRERERRLLADALDQARSEQSAQLVTLVGVPGIGKSRLVAELFQITDADEEIISWRQGRSLPYGERVSFWALGEIVKAHAGILESDDAATAEAKLMAMVETLGEDERERDWLVRHTRPLVGLEGAERAEREEAFAAWRRLLEAAAENRPLILVFEDLHWADDGLLDFVDHLADWATTVPLLIVGTARPELLDRRPGWGGGKRNAFTLSIGALSDDETAVLLQRLLDRAVLDADTQQAVLRHAEGNPLYAEEYARMLAEHEGGEISLPETVQGLIAARIDGLAPAEKALLQDASVIGKVFWPDVVPGADEHILHALERKEFIRRDRRSSIAGETQYAFLHALVRDVAYGQIPAGGEGREASTRSRVAGFSRRPTAPTTSPRCSPATTRRLSPCPRRRGSTPPRSACRHGRPSPTAPVARSRSGRAAPLTSSRSGRWHSRRTTPSVPHSSSWRRTPAVSATATTSYLSERPRSRPSWLKVTGGARRTRSRCWQATTSIAAISRRRARPGTGRWTSRVRIRRHRRPRVRWRPSPGAGISSTVTPRARSGSPVKHSHSRPNRTMNRRRRSASTRSGSVESGRATQTEWPTSSAASSSRHSPVLCSTS